MGFLDAIRRVITWSQEYQAEHAPSQVTRTYEGEKAMRRGVAQMARQGWQVVTTAAYQPRSGIGRIVTLGVGAAVFPPKTKFVVTFARA